MPFGQLEYEFTESLYVNGSVEAGELSGIAVIDYDRDGLWTVEHILLDGWDKQARKFNARVAIPHGSEVYHIILERLNAGRTSEFIGSEVWDAIEKDKEGDPDHARELLREAV